MMRLPLPTATLLVLTLASGRAAMAAEDLPPDRQAALMLRVLPYDRNLRERAPEAVTIAVLYREGRAESEAYGLDMAAALQDAARGAQIRGLPVRIVSIPYASPEALEAAVSRSQVTAVYFCPGLTDAEESILGVTQRYKVLSFSGRESDVRQGLSIGLLRRGSKAGLLVNLRAAIAEGAELQPEMLAVSEVLR
ncbi:YfiR family protein [Hyalangium versicolor]|uniref:YfiR family protein n=1 Tax=Hyalangium versicolor TaxID=2861190 RepID=UPI001CCAAD72|nr:YfiR family protein [Hyalangium versicolor]